VALNGVAARFDLPTMTRDMLETGPKLATQETQRGPAKLEALYSTTLETMQREGRLKGSEHVITDILPPQDVWGPRYLLDGYGKRAFVRLNANAYLGLNTDPRVVAAEEEAVRRFGTGPGAVRFISGTFQPHVELEQRLAAFHGREAAMVLSAAYATVMGIVPLLLSEQTLVLSDALNHNCIINAMRLARPGFREVYAHLRWPN
jgi:glycine C-acetyltransferase